MTDFAPNVTVRYVLKYTSVGRAHNIMMRTQRGTGFALAESYGQTFFNGLFDSLKSIMASDLAFISAAIAVEDSDLFFPAAIPTAVTGALSPTLFSKQDSISHVTFSGRGTLGSKVNLHIYGLSLQPDALPAQIENDFVITAAESGVITAALAILTGDTHIRAIDNSQPAWRTQVTLKVNDYWLRKVRSGA